MFRVCGLRWCICRTCSLPHTNKGLISPSYHSHSELHHSTNHSSSGKEKVVIVARFSPPPRPAATIQMGVRRPFPSGLEFSRAATRHENGITARLDVQSLKARVRRASSSGKAFPLGRTSAASVSPFVSTHSRESLGVRHRHGVG